MEPRPPANVSLAPVFRDIQPSSCLADLLALPFAVQFADHARCIDSHEEVGYDRAGSVNESRRGRSAALQIPPDHCTHKLPAERPQHVFRVAGGSAQPVLQPES